MAVAVMVAGAPGVLEGSRLPFQQTVSVMVSGQSALGLVDQVPLAVTGVALLVAVMAGTVLLWSGSTLDDLCTNCEWLHCRTVLH